MSRREKIFVFMAVLAVLYGAYSFFIASPAGKSKPATVSRGVSKEINAVNKNRLVKEISDALKESESARAEAYIALRAEEKWTDDPFSASNMSVSKRTGKAVRSMREGNFVYSGYLEIGKKKVVIINGMDYQAGDELEMSGYKVKRISPSRVVVVDKRSGGKITIPFLKED